MKSIFLLTLVPLLLIHVSVAKPATNYSLINTDTNEENFAVQTMMLQTDKLTVCFWWRFLQIAGEHVQTMINIMSSTQEIILSLNWEGVLGSDGKINLEWLGRRKNVGYNMNHGQWRFYCVVADQITGTNHWNVQFFIGWDWPSTFTCDILIDYFVPVRIWDAQTTLTIFHTQSTGKGGQKQIEAAVGELTCLNIWREVFQVVSCTLLAGCQVPGDVYHLSPGSIQLNGGGLTESYTVPLTPRNTEAPVPTNSADLMNVSHVVPSTPAEPSTTVVPSTPVVLSTSEELSTSVVLSTPAERSTPVTKEANQPMWEDWILVKSYRDRRMPGLKEHHLDFPTELACIDACITRKCNSVNYDTFSQVCEIGSTNRNGTVFHQHSIHYEIDPN